MTDRGKNTKKLSVAELERMRRERDLKEASEAAIERLRTEKFKRRLDRMRLLAISDLEGLAGGIA